MAARPLHHEDRMKIRRTFCHTGRQTTDRRQLQSLPQECTVPLLSATCGTMLIRYHPNRKFRDMRNRTVTFTLGAMKMIAVPSRDTIRKRIALIYKLDILLQLAKHPPPFTPQVLHSIQDVNRSTRYRCKPADSYFATQPK